MTTQALDDIKLIDSVMRELQGLNPLFVGESGPFLANLSNIPIKFKQIRSDDTL